MTIAAIGTALAVGSSILGGVQSYTAAKYRAQVADMNAKIAEGNAERAIQTSQVEQQDSDAMTLAALGELTASQGASGISLGSASSQRGRRAVRVAGRQDALRIRQAGEVERYNFQTDAANFRSEKAAAKSEGMFSLLSIPFNVGSSLIGGAGKVASPGKFGALGSGARLPRPRPRSLLR